MDFDLADALDDKNDRKAPGRSNVNAGEGMLISPLQAACRQDLKEILPCPSWEHGLTARHHRCQVTA